MMTMTEEDLAKVVGGLLEGALSAEDLVTEGIEIERVATFRDAGLMTNNDGLVLRLADGSEFQLQIVQSRGPRR